MSDKEAYERKLEAKLGEWQADIDKLRAQAKEAGADAQIQYQKQIDELRKYRDDMETRLAEMREAQSAAWTDIKGGVDKAWDDMSKAMQDAWKRLS
jgi:DNA anti-recombination protein RmuC